MKLNNLKKNFYIFISVSLSIFIVSILWEHINLEIKNTLFTNEFLKLKNYNPTSETLRYILFITLPLIVFIFLSQYLKGKRINIEKIIFEKNENVINSHPFTLAISLIFLIFILLEFFSINFYSSNRNLDHAHDGNYLTATYNYLSTKELWSSSFLIRGGSDIFYPLFVWKIFGIKSIATTRTFSIFLILFLKVLSIVLSYQFTKILKLNEHTKIIFFTIFTSILISMSSYTFFGSGSNYYFGPRDIFIILFLIFFIELFVESKFKLLSLILSCFIATSSILFHIDTGIYINFILFLYFIYLIIIKKYNDVFLIFTLLIIFWFVAINLISFNEFKTFLSNSITIIQTMDFMLGLEYPEPFFSINTNSDGARATRGLLLQITAGLFVINYLISNESKIFTSKKIFFVFLFILSLIMFKNALVRSDSGHIRGSQDLPILINSFFVINYFLTWLEKKFVSKKSFFLISLIFLLSFFFINQKNYNINNIKNFKNNFISFINLKDDEFLNQKTKKFIKYYNEISKKDDCVENITFFDAVPYLLNKPSCTKYWVSCYASPIFIQKDYINKIKKVQPNFVLYSSINYTLDGIGIYERIELVNSYIMSNYKKHKEIGGFIILEKK